MALTKIKKAFGFGVEEKSLSLTDPEVFPIFGVTPTASGVSVGPSNAMRVPAVNCAVSLISETIGDLPFKLYGRASKEARMDHAAYRLVHDEANEWTNANDLRKQLTRDALLHGSGHALLIRLNDETPYEFRRLEPGKIQQRFEPDGEPFYLVSTDQGQERWSYRDVLRIEVSGGVSPITMGREAIALALAFER